jgi:hypothetical protein
MSEDHQQSSRPVWLAIILIVATIVASGTAVLFHLFGAAQIPTFAAAGAAFAGTVTLCIAIWNFLDPSSHG